MSKPPSLESQRVRAASQPSFGTFDVAHSEEAYNARRDDTCCSEGVEEEPAERTFEPGFASSADAYAAVRVSARNVVVSLLENGRTLVVSHKVFQAAPRASASDVERSLAVTCDSRGLNLPGLTCAVHPATTAVRLWTTWMLVLTLTYCAFAEPVFIAFATALASSPLANACDLLSGASFALDVLVNFRIGSFYACEGHVKLVLDPATLAADYRARNLLVDVLAAVPFFAQAAYLLASHAAGTPPAAAGGIVVFMRALRLLRVFRLWAQFASGGALLGTEVFVAQQTGTPLVIFSVGVLYFFAVCVNVMACIFILTATNEGFCNSWVLQLAVHSADHPRALQTCGGALAAGLALPGQHAVYVSALYFATATLTTVGYGDVVAITTTEKVVVILFMLSGAFFIAAITSHMVSVLGKHGAVGSRPDEEAFKDRMLAADRFVKEHRLPGALREAVMAYVQQAYTPLEPRFGWQAELLTELPMPLRAAAVHTILGEGTLPRAFLGASPDTMVWLAGRLEPRSLHTGHFLFVTGDAATELYVTASGSLLLTSPSGRHVGSPLPGRGYLVGGAAAARALRGSETQLWPLSATAVVESTVFVLPYGALQTAIRMGVLATAGRTQAEETEAVSASLLVADEVERALQGGTAGDWQHRD